MAHTESPPPKAARGKPSLATSGAAASPADQNALTDDRFALVPFLATVPAEAVAPPVRELQRVARAPSMTWAQTILGCVEKFDENYRDLVSSYVNSIHVRFLIWSLKMMLHLAWYVPILAGYALLALVVRCVHHFTKNPDQLVVAGFRVVDAGLEAGPSYISYAFDRVVGQIYNETTTRLR